MATATLSPNGSVPGDDALPSHVRVAIIGTGFAGLGMAIRMKQAGMHDFVVLERAEDVGGTWRDNTYPGCQCDIPSNLYSFSFAQNPEWSRTFPVQPEIWEYLRRCADDFEVTPHVRFRAEVQSAAWDDDEAVWRLETPRGTLEADVMISGMGGLSEPSIPRVSGLDSFEGPAFHSATWNHDLDLRGKRVAVVGTGASAIQFVPKIQPDVEKLYLLQRTPPWIVPHNDRAVTGVEKRVYSRFPALQNAVRSAIYWARELLVPGFAWDKRFLKLPEAIARRHLRDQVDDPELRAKLTPDYAIGCKRIIISNDYYPALAQPNVEVLTGGVSEIRPHSVVSGNGEEEREVDAIIFGTGFLVTDMPVAARVRGRDGKLLDELWQGSPQAYLGSAIAGFPNFFMLTGPNTGLGHNSMVYMIESHIQYVLDALRTMDRHGIDVVEVRSDKQENYNAAIQRRMKRTVWTTGGCASWYIDANGRNTTLWPGFTWRFRQLTRRFDVSAYTARARTRAPAREKTAVPA
jgi:cation diffusion facilitator CzcD-associated flavoprotein CzcO